MADQKFVLMVDFTSGKSKEEKLYLGGIGFLVCPKCASQKFRVASFEDSPSHIHYICAGCRVWSPCKQMLDGGRCPKSVPSD